MGATEGLPRSPQPFPSLLRLGVSPPPCFSLTVEMRSHSPHVRAQPSEVQRAFSRSPRARPGKRSADALPQGCQRHVCPSAPPLPGQRDSTSLCLVLSTLQRKQTVCAVPSPGGTEVPASSSHPPGPWGAVAVTHHLDAQARGGAPRERIAPAALALR